MTIIINNINNNAAAKAATETQTETKKTVWLEPIGYKITGKNPDIRSKEFNLNDLSWEEINVDQDGMMTKPARVGQGNFCLEQNLYEAAVLFEEHVAFDLRMALVYSTREEPTIDVGLHLGDAAWRCIQYCKKYWNQTDPKITKIRELYNSLIERCNDCMENAVNAVKIHQEQLKKLHEKIAELERENAEMTDELDQLRNDVSAHADDIYN